MAKVPEFKKFLYEIGNDINNGELCQILFLISGKLISKKEMENIKSPLCLFYKLEELLEIKEGDVSLLTGLFEIIKRNDLAKRCDSYHKNFPIKTSHGLSSINEVAIEEANNAGLNNNKWESENILNMLSNSNNSHESIINIQNTFVKHMLETDSETKITSVDKFISTSVHKLQNCKNGITPESENSCMQKSYEVDSENEIKHVVAISNNAQDTFIKGSQLDSKNLIKLMYTNIKDTEGMERVQTKQAKDSVITTMNRIVEDTIIKISKELNSKNEIKSMDGNINRNSTLVSKIFLNKDFNLRKYQIELAQPALKKINCIICAPTGSGKTLTTAFICKKFIEANDKAKIIFIVNIRNLAAQQKDELSKLLESKVFHVSETSSIMDNFRSNNVLVMTAQVFVNMLLYDGTCKISDLDMLIFDECHHTTLGHPYNKIMKIYLEEKDNNGAAKLPQILGITASLGTDGESTIDKIKDHYIKLCANMDCNHIVIVKQPENIEELNNYCPKPKENQIVLCKPRIVDDFIKVSTELMNEIEKQTNSDGQCPKGSPQYENWIVHKIKEIEKTINPEKTRMFKDLQVLNECLLKYSDLTMEIVINYMKNNTELENTIKEMFFKRIECDELIIHNNEKLEALYNTISEMCSLGSQMGIILTRTCFNVKSLCKLIQSNDKLKDKIVVFELLGQSNADYGMTEAEQVEIIKKIKRAELDLEKCCLLVATDIAQEGLDLPKCNFVIRYNFVSNEIGTVQSKGRARAKNSLIFLIVDEDSVNLRREIENLEKESKMQETLLKISEEDSENLIKQIKAKQISDLEDRKAEREKEKASKTENPADIQIVCKKCKSFLFYASKIKQKYSHYICIDSNLKKRIKVEKSCPIREFSQDTQEGRIACIGENCRQAIGTYIRYKQGKRNEGYTIGKNNIMIKRPENDVYEHMPKTWDKLNFKIEQINDS